VDYNEIRQYLLSPIPEDDNVGMLIAADDSAFALAEQVESDLIDDYLLGSLSDADRNAFETNYLANDKAIQKLELARVIATLSVELLDEKNDGKGVTSKTRLLVLSVAAGLVIIVISGLSLFQIDLPQHPNSSVIPEPSKEQIKDESELGREIKSNESFGLENEIPKTFGTTVILRSGNMRGRGYENKMSSKNAAGPIELQLKMEIRRGFERFRLKVETPEGENVAIKNRFVKRTVNDVTFVIPSGLDRGTYLLFLFGSNDSNETQIGEYSLVVK
jgi:hypothetical protein